MSIYRSAASNLAGNKWSWTIGAERLWSKNRGEQIL